MSCYFSSSFPKIRHANTLMQTTLFSMHNQTNFPDILLLLQCHISGFQPLQTIRVTVNLYHYWRFFYQLFTKQV